MSGQGRLPISVIVPVFNNQEHLGECLKSLQDQTRAPEEIVLVDDASTDGSVAVAQSLQLPKLRIIRNPQNIGAAASRSVALNESTQPFTAFLDSDDYLSRDALEAGFEKLQNTGADICLFTVTKFEDGGNHILWRLEVPAEPLTGDEALAMTMPQWRLHALGVHRRFVVERAQSKFQTHGFSDDEVLFRLILAESTTVVGCQGTYFYRNVPKPYTFNRLVGQTRTNIRSAQLLEERCGELHPAARTMRKIVTRSLAGLLLRAMKRQGSVSEVALLHAESRRLRSPLRWTDIPFLLAQLGISTSVMLAGKLLPSHAMPAQRGTGTRR